MKYISIISCLFLFSCTKEEDANLINKWRLDSYIVDGSSTVVNIPTPVFYEFKNNQILVVEMAANTCSGSYSNTAEDISFNSFNCTEICCDSTYSENAYELMLDSVQTYNISGSVLQLKGPSHTVLQFTKDE